ncbi:DMT family transporter [Alphaproteobacteria bacterium KMM 3653]|uniref:DMT family transporter n=1 Tax=Harenicola maris TaxID=2841044 RepID=A0AAP2CT27_9RHOB|nr:DMT family transporter [Harenicola maris]
MVAASAFIAGTMLAAKLLGTDSLGPPLHPLQISHGRFLFAFIAIATTAAALRPKFDPPNWRLHMGRTLCGWSGVTLMFASVAFIPLPDATAISFLNPVFAMLLAIPLLGERVGPWRWVAAVLAVIGALVLIRPGAGTFQAAALLAVGAAVLMGLELILIKKLSGRENPLQILLTNNAMGLTIASIAVLFVFAAPTPMQWLVLAALGFLMASAQACFVNAMARADASFATPFSYLTLVFAGAYDIAVFQAIPDWVSILGAVIILGGAALLAWREGVARRRA